ncbi:MAG: hypothetical protein IBJ13_03345 [Sphingopyxis sp.]|nr:hypothetical protein [Sphingopyxis sp.]
MPHIDYAALNRWENYHASVQQAVTEHGTYRQSGSAAADGPAAFAESAATLLPHIGRAIALGTSPGVLGATWSWSEIAGNPALQLGTAELGAIFEAEARHLHGQSACKPDYCVFLGGGAILSDLVTWAELRGRSIKTCGSYLGQSVAGAMATSVNGSALRYGGFQNQICGIHLLVGETRSVWVERKSKPALADEAALAFAQEIIRDDAIFEDCLVHLGAMGIVNGVLFELVDKDPFVAVRLKHRVDASWASDIEAGEFDRVAAAIGVTGDLAYYEVQLDPFEPYGKAALHTFYVRETTPVASAHVPKAIPTVLDGLAALYDNIEKGEEPELPPDFFDYYATTRFQVTPVGGPKFTQSWGELHAAQPATETHQMIYSAALAIDRDRLSDTIAATSAAMQAMLTSGPPETRLRHMIYTLRFVSGASGTMAFTRQNEAVVLDLEGIKFSPASLRAAADSCTALRGAGIAYCQHWGKSIPGDPLWVEREYGAANANRPLERWRATRMALLDPAAAAVFTSPALLRWRVL